MSLWICPNCKTLYGPHAPLCLTCGIPTEFAYIESGLKDRDVVGGWDFGVEEKSKPDDHLGGVRDDCA